MEEKRVLKLAKWLHINYSKRKKPELFFYIKAVKTLLPKRGLYLPANKLEKPLCRALSVELNPCY
jgi:hypothetical protein